MESSLQNRADMRVILNQRISLVIAVRACCNSAEVHRHRHAWIHALCDAKREYIRPCIVKNCIDWDGMAVDDDAADELAGVLLLCDRALSLRMRCPKCLRSTRICTLI